MPEKCLGSKLIICASGPEIGSGHLKCARGLITHRDELLSSCKVTISKHQDQPLIKAVDINQYMLASRGENIAIHCPSMPEMNHKLKRGTFNLTCTAPCIISGEGWSFSCLDKLYLAKRFVFSEMRVISSFNLSREINMEQLHRAFPQIHLPMSQPLNDVSISALPQPIQIKKQVHKSFMPSPLAIVALILIMFIMIALAIVIFQWKQCKTKLLNFKAYVMSFLPILTAINSSHPELQPPPKVTASAIPKSTIITPPHHTPAAGSSNLYPALPTPDKEVPTPPITDIAIVHQ